MFHSDLWRPQSLDLCREDRFEQSTESGPSLLPEDTPFSGSEVTGACTLWAWYGCYPAKSPSHR